MPGQTRRLLSRADRRLFGQTGLSGQSHPEDIHEFGVHQRLIATFRSRTIAGMSSAVANPESSSGLSLAARLNEGSSNAWRELVDLYGPLIESWCRQAGVPEAARADIGQEVLLAVHRGVAGFNPNHPRATFRGWLWTITRNAVLQWRRRHEPAGLGGSAALNRLEEVPDPWGEREAEAPPADSNDTANLISRALDQIRPQVEDHTWNAFWNTAVLGQSATEAAVELGMTAMAVRQAKSRVLRRLRKQLGDIF